MSLSQPIRSQTKLTCDLFGPSFLVLTSQFWFNFVTLVLILRQVKMSTSWYNFARILLSWSMRLCLTSAYWTTYILPQLYGIPGLFVQGSPLRGGEHTGTCAKKNPGEKILSYEKENYSLLIYLAENLTNYKKKTCQNKNVVCGIKKAFVYLETNEKARRATFQNSGWLCNQNTCHS